MEDETPIVNRIVVEYEDGSKDIIQLLQSGNYPLYGLTRASPESQQPMMAYSAGAIAALLFSTTIRTRQTEYSLRDRRLVDLLRCWFGDSPPNPKNSKRESTEP